MAGLIKKTMDGLSNINPFKSKPEPEKKKFSLIGWIKNHKVETIGMAATAVLTTALVATAVATCVLSCGTSGLIACAALGVGATVATGGTAVSHFVINTCVLREDEKEKPRDWRFPAAIAIGIAGGVMIGCAAAVGGALAVGSATGVVVATVVVAKRQPLFAR
jgi:hypothetical protein